MPPAAKRPRSDGAATVAEWSKKVKCLSKETSHALLAGLMASLPVVRGIVEAEIAKVEPVDLSFYSGKASSIVSSLDGLRASQQYQRFGEVLERLVELVDACKEELSNTDAFAAMVAILEVVHSEAEGEVRKGVVGNFDYQVAEQLDILVDNMSPEQHESVSDAVNDLESVVEDTHCCGEGLKTIVMQMRGDQ